MCVFTGPEVALDDHLVLLLVPPCDDQVVLGADEPQELLEPARMKAAREQSGDEKRALCSSAGSSPVDLPGFLDGRHSLDLLQCLLSFLLGRFHGLEEQRAQRDSDWGSNTPHSTLYIVY